MRQKKYWIIFVLLSLAFLAWTASSAYDVRVQGRFTGQNFRFVAKQLRNGASTGIASPGVLEAGVLIEGCVYRSNRGPQ